MTVAISNTGNNQNFGYWLNRTNELAYALSVYAVTANGSNAAVGNAAITGQFNANTLNLTYSANLGTYMVIGPWNTNPDANSAYVNTTHISVGNVSVNSVVNATSMRTYSTVYVGSNVVVNTSQVFIGESVTNAVYDKWHIVFQGNSSVNTTANSTTIQITNNAISSVLTFDTLWVGNSVINATMITTANEIPTGFTANTTAFMLGPNLYANNTTLVLGYTSTSNVLSNSTYIDVRSPAGNVKVNSVLISLANSSSIANLTSDNLRIGNSYVNSTIITTGNVTVNTTAIVVGAIVSPVLAITAYSNNNVSIYGESNSSIGVYGKSNSSYALQGYSASSYGVLGISNTSIAVVGISNTNWGGYFVSNTGNPFFAGNNTTEFFRVAATGYVGIGNTNPGHNLSINGNVYVLSSVNIAANFIANTTGIYHTGTANVNTLTSGSNTGTATAITGYSNTSYGVYGISSQNAGVLGLSNTSYGVYGLSNSAVGVVGESKSNYGGYFISTSGISLFAGNNTTEFFRVTPTGNVGVGSTSATDSKFRVYDSNTLAGLRISYAGSSVNYYDANTHYFRDTGSNIRVTANTTGVGIGNTTFTDRLAVGGSVYFDSTLQVVTSVNSAAYTVGTATIANATGVYTTGTVNAAVQSVGSFVIANTSGVYVSNSVNSNTVRIGASSVNTSVNSTAFFATNGTQTTTINATSISTNANINGTGNVDIGSGVAGSAYANVRGDMFVRGNLQVSGNLAYTGVATGDIVPFGNTYNLGSSTNRWGIWGAAINASGTITASQNITVNTNIFLGDGISTTQITITPPNITQRNHGNTYLNANGSWTALPTIPVTNNVVITSGTTQQTIDSITLGTYAYDYVIHVSDSSGNRMATKILVSSNSTAINSSEYAQIGNLGAFTTDVSAGVGYLYFTPSVSSSTVRFTKVQSS